MGVLGMGGNASKVNIKHLVNYFKMDKDAFICKFCGIRRKKCSRKLIYEHFVSDYCKIRCVNMQRCPKCRDLVLRNGLQTHLRDECRFNDVHFMKCDACKAAPHPVMAPHKRWGLGCMRDFLQNRLDNPKKYDLNDLYGHQNGPTSIADIIFKKN